MKSILNGEIFPGPTEITAPASAPSIVRCNGNRIGLAAVPRPATGWPDWSVTHPRSVACAFPTVVETAMCTTRSPPLASPPAELTAMLMEKPDEPCSFDAVIVYVEEGDAALGVPEITPLVGSSAIPGGSGGTTS